MGVKKGVSDLFLAYPSNGYHGWWGEGKRDKKCSLSDEQNDWIKRQTELGFKCDVWYSAEHAIELITNYLRC